MLRWGIGLQMKQVFLRWGGDQQFTLGRGKCEMSIRPPSGDAEDTIEYTDLEFGREVFPEIQI